ncbi:hypothetical protein DMJ13_27310 [halophilic archaeon]|nr:hypothetical protein DMJ13_27310 [halophilic archaeon]
MPSKRTIESRLEDLEEREAKYGDGEDLSTRERIRRACERTAEKAEGNPDKAGSLAEAIRMVENENEDGDAHGRSP